LGLTLEIYQQTNPQNMLIKNNRQLYKDPTNKVDCSRRQDREQQPGKAVAHYGELKDRVEES